MGMAPYDAEYFDHVALDRGRVLPRLIETRAANQPDTPFATLVDGPSLTYGQTHAEALRWATALDRLGAGPERTVASMLPIGLPALTAWLGISWLRAWEVPINTDFRGRMLTHILRNSAAEILILHASWWDRLVRVQDEVPELKHVLLVGWDGPVPGSRFEVHLAENLLDAVTEPGTFTGPEPSDVAAILYTSGTTGPSKGVITPWAHLIAMFNQPLWDDFGPEDHQYSPFPLYHLSGKGCVMGAARDGAQVILKPKWSGNEFWSDIKRYGGAFTWLVGGMPALLYGKEERPDDADNPLKYALMAPIIPEYEAFSRRFGVKLMTSYGMTEMSMPVVTDWGLPNDRTCGRARAGYQVRVVDEQDVPVGPNEFGEIIVRSNTPWTLNVGYLGMPDKTAEAWRHGWFHTGDGGHFDEDGNLYFDDRIKDVIRRRGENISSMEVEAEVLTHPGVTECAAIGVPNKYGEEDVAIFVIAPGVDLPELSDYLAERMSRFMIPRYIQHVDEIPRTPTARIRKVELRELVDLDAAYERTTGAPSRNAG